MFKKHRGGSGGKTANNSPVLGKYKEIMPTNVLRYASSPRRFRLASYRLLLAAVVYSYSFSYLETRDMALHRFLHTN